MRKRFRVENFVVIAIFLDEKCDTSKKKVTFKRLNKQEMDEYLSTNEWKDKAGAYAIQGYAEKFIKRINGSYSNVVGLPLFETYNLLNSQGLI